MEGKTKGFERIASIFNEGNTRTDSEVFEEILKPFLVANPRKAHYNKKGLYSSYDKNHKEREALDYYSTPIEEVENILNTMNLDLNNTTILEPCCGGGHMVQGIANYCYKYDSKLWKLYATDIKDRNSILQKEDYKAGSDYDFLSDDYPCCHGIDYIIMNPPYSVIEPFVMKALGIAEKGMLMLGRLQFLEGQGRYENIFKHYPPTDVYVYVDRIFCYKNGDTSIKQSSAQVYAWFFWDLKGNSKDTKMHWIRRADKKEC